MVRLEKVIYEQVINSAAVSRTRKLSAPRKWNTTSPRQHMALLGYNAYEKSFFGRIVKPIVQRYFAFQTSFRRDMLLQRGLTFEDLFLHHDTQLRRCVLFEHMARESLHPYHWVLKTRRRQRYYKVERGLRGFFVPQFIRAQVRTQTYQDMVRLKRQWSTHTHNNYYSDMTPSAHRTVIPKLFLPELALNYGLFKNEAWARFFMNEVDNQWYSEKELSKVRNNKSFPYDLTTEKGKRLFETDINKLNQIPGMLTVEGQKFDFKAYYNELGV